MMNETRRPTSSKSLRPSFIESILGKRPTAARAIKKNDGEDDGDDENIVTKVESKDDMITFEDQDKKMKKQSDRKKDPYDLP